ncbi:polysaccharide pyruvyl transferase family protein [Photobacterium minamisatsumaniensis]|uniref:polysaccharide pyruvyl transferase family protein n=1 Tax=Photobacterium minamisatsumaniensis TaxID=2910233 RepID=UPI003D09D17F
MKNLKEKLKVIVDDIGDSKVHYLDYPLHYNIGDLLIYLGTESFFEDNNINVIGRYTLYEANSDWVTNKIKDDDVIIFHGGGNFGDIYEVCQDLRHNIIKKFPNNKIIILPQSVHFNSLNKRKISQSIHRNHQNLSIFVRDIESYEIVKDYSTKVMLMPDMAHYLYGSKFLEILKSETNIEHSDLFLSRTDKEISNIPRSSTPEGTVNFDWFDLVSIRDELKRKVINVLLRTIGKRINLSSILSKLWLKQSKKMAIVGGRKILSTDHLYTNRLHGMIFAHLLDKKVNVTDNSYGKNSRYYNLWLNKLGMAVWNKK